MDTCIIEIPNDKKEMKIFQEKMNDISKQYRKEALKIVLENGQPFDPKRNGSDEELFSEGLY